VSDAAPAPAGPAERSEPRSTPVELLWDLVFAFALTQVTALIAEQPSWEGAGRGLILLALVWWAWSAFVWAVNAQASGGEEPRVVLLAATGAIFLAGLALPRAFGSEGLLFAGAYAAVRLLHLGLYVQASRAGRAGRAAISGFAATVVAGLVLLLAGALAPGGGARAGLWLAALAIDYAGPAWLTRERLRGLQRVAVSHFAERYGLFVIICLGESIVSAGAGALAGPGGSTHALRPAAVLAAAALLAATAGLWWAYFAGAAEAAQERLREHGDPVLAAADAYSYLHVPIVAGVILFAAGARLLLRTGAGAGLPIAGRLALCAGIALYLLGHLAFLVRLGVPEAAGLARGRAAAAGLLAALAALSSGLAGWALALIAASLLAALMVLEARSAAD
jgi:low temperature requirement protein LtrA